MVNCPHCMILIIDDDKAVRTSLLLLLEEVGYEAKDIAAPREALVYLNHNTPSLIILDLNCTSLDPLKLIEHLKSTTALRGITLIGFVSHVQAELIQKAREAGCDIVLARSAFSKNLPQILKRHTK